jgi:hypothetical protein
METENITSKRIADGVYLASNGYTVQRLEDWDGAGIGTGWHLIDPEGEWCQTYATKRDALAAAGRAAADPGDEG